MVEVLRYTAFSADPAGGNPAGVVLDATGLSDAEMLEIAASVGYSETAFVVPRADGFGIRYFSPVVEVPFCGHATVATAVASGIAGRLVFHTPAGVVEVETADGAATLTSVPTSSTPAPAADVAAALAALGWTADDLDVRYPVHWAFGGSTHLVVVVRGRSRLAALDYDFDALGDLLRAHGAVTADLLWQAEEDVFHARNPFPVGGVVEDPATGSAAAAFGGYLRALGVVAAPRVITVHQGVDMGRPSELVVDVRPDDARVRVTGRAVPIAG
ncbi:PhzF family phenazine biosynthesis protein [Saccharothrix violaceirubra]|uniref:PhzF family phenazine biosynthesis protein n=1 Tax=Saccharothrix violaceirubra TaxID=413306 RepID=A0A7W7T976_9PSEU|nr:PhzF family phenazine biosynthesis isomerase [Saccharothrix violaceirubra]MBB4968681.1 PhzF family phenazine biosynthesis protein [Saccharothrix violaceirubra]